MFKVISEMKKRDERGFTLIELLIVIAILGILMAIAIPAYLGQREKARVRAVESSAKGAVSEIQGYLDSMIAGDPFIILNSSGAEICLESNLGGQKNCLTVYQQAAAGTYAGSGNLASNLVPFVIAHHNGKNEKSPFNPGLNLFANASGTAGTVVVTATGNRTIRVNAFGADTTNALYDTNVTAR